MRIDWSPDERLLITRADGSVEVHEVDGSIQTLATDCLDARWLADGRIIAMTRQGRIRYFPDDQNVRFAQRTFALRAQGYSQNLRIPYSAAALAANGTAYVAIANSSIFFCMSEDDARHEYWLLGRDYRVGFEVDGVSATVSADGNMIAIGYRTRNRQANKGARRGRRGWLVVDRRRRKMKPDRGLLVRSWYEVENPRGHTLVAFDGARQRLAIAAPEKGPGVGVIRMPTHFTLDAASGISTTYPRNSPGETRALALDDRGVIVAYAQGRRLRIDYLDPTPTGDPSVAVQDTLWIDPECVEIDTIAFSKDSRRIACLGADGVLAIVPVL